jgi:aldehyde:ferredoxin oxidoreductase
MAGWVGRILDISLTDGSVETVPLDLDMAYLYLDGRDLGARLLWDLVGLEVEPLALEKVLIFATGPLTASGAQTSNCFSVTTKSPLTGTIVDTISGGWRGMRFKRNSYDALIVRENSPKPTRIEITPDGVPIKDASHLGGRKVQETSAALGQKSNKRNVLCIGPAGENLSKIVAIMNDGHRSVARGGVGAVMGSKNLKAIVTVGTQKNTARDQEKFKFMLYETGKIIKQSPLTSKALPQFGTSAVMNPVNAIGALPTRNFQQNQFENAEAISGERMEMPAYDPRGMQGQGLLYATSNRDACHRRGNMFGPEVLALPRLVDRLATQDKAGIVAVHHDTASVVDSLVVCNFTNMAATEEHFARLLTAITGRSYTTQDLSQTGRRIWNLERLYNLREGITADDDTLPDRLLNDPVDEGPSAGFTVKSAPMLQDYDKFHGWDEQVMPLPETLEELQLEALV